MDLQGKRLLICEEALVDHKGHFYSWHQAIAAFHKERGAEVLIAGSIRVEPAIQKELGVLPHYTHNNWSGIYNYGNPLLRYGCVFLHNWRVYQQTRAALKHFGPVDCIFVTSARIHHLIAWYRLCRKYMGKRFQRLVVFLPMGNGVYDENHTLRFKRSAALIQKVMRLYRRWLPTGEVCFCTDSHVTADDYQQLTGIKVVTLPTPNAVSFNDAQPKPKPGQSGPLFMTLGLSFYDKGTNIIQDAVLQFLQKHPHTQAKFLIHWPNECITPEGDKVEIKDALRDHPNVTVLEDILSSDEFNAMLVQADCLVLPYRRSTYFNRNSNITVLAACAGIPSIVTENTWLSWKQSQFGAGLTCKDGDAADLCRQYERFIAEWDTLRTRAISQQKLALNYNSADNYLRCLWEKKAV